MNDPQTLLDSLTRSFELLVDVIPSEDCKWLLEDCVQTTKILASTAVSGTQAATVESFDLHLCTKRIFNLLKLQCETRHVCFSPSILDGVPFKVRGDPSALCHVLRTLVSGALKFFQPSLSGFISCDVRSRGQMGKKVVVEIRMQHPTTFMHDTQGLATCRELVRRMGGDLVFTQQNAVTSVCFTVLLDLDNHDPALDAPIPSVLAGPTVYLEQERDDLCDHVAYWKRLRTKRGVTSFVCTFCSKKWRTVNGCVVQSTENLQSLPTFIGAAMQSDINIASSAIPEQPNRPLVPRMLMHSASAQSFFGPTTTAPCTSPPHQLVKSNSGHFQLSQILQRDGSLGLENSPSRPKKSPYFCFPSEATHPADDTNDDDLLTTLHL